jgi:hypothetical protein
MARMMSARCSLIPRIFRTYPNTVSSLIMSQKPGCYAYDLAAWRVRLHIKNDAGDIWTKAANYHSRTPEYNTVYRADLIARAVKWADWLEARFVAADTAGS